MKKLIVANWKMNPLSPKEAETLFSAIPNSKFQIPNSLELIICPPFIYLETLSRLLKSKNHKLKAKLGAQDCFWENPPAGGAYTGEISPLMLKNLGVEYVIVGHSERRNYLGETDEMVDKKIKAVLKAKLKPILCIGETEKERKEGKTFQVLKRQLNGALINSSTHQLINLITAYEPVWAIGTGNYCQPKEAVEMIKFIKKVLNSKFYILNSKVLYGGSVDSKNIADYLKYPEIEGALVGGASIKINEFQKIINEISKPAKTSSTPK